MAKDKKQKEPRRKPKYGMWTCIKWLASKLWEWDRAAAICCIAAVPLALVLYGLGLYVPTATLNVLETADGFHTVALTVTTLLVTQLFFRLLKTVVDDLRGLAYHDGAMRFYYAITKKGVDDDFYLNLDKEHLTRRRRTFDVLRNSADGSPTHYLLDGVNALVNVLCFVMFGSVISLLHPAILLLLVAGSLVTHFLQKRQQNRNHAKVDEQTAVNKKIMYLAWNLSAYSAPGKDIRLYGMTSFFDSRGKKLIKEHIRLLKYRQNNQSVVTVGTHLVTALRDGVAYAVLIYAAVEGRVTPGEFVLYFSAISQMSGFIGGIIGYFGSFHEMKLKTSDCIEYLEEDHNRLRREGGIPKPEGRPLSVEFKNVTFKYPEGDKNVLENVSFKMEAGEKISLVGLNGAGKTTLTWLMCGLLLPDQGEVLIDGHSVYEYNREDLYSLFSLLPQRYTILPTSIAENVAMADRKDVDEARLWSALETAGIADRIRRLPQGVETGMSKEFDAQAVNLSGGEMQKLLLARALYHRAPIMILDEPTAALDPIAEHEMYLKYNEISENTTSVFISHRLASARFCDRIYLLDGARFAECGTHEELMAKGGKYKELFDIQSKYYKEGAKNDN